MTRDDFVKGWRESFEFPKVIVMQDGKRYRLEGGDGCGAQARVVGVAWNGWFADLPYDPFREVRVIQPRWKRKAR